MRRLSALALIVASLLMIAAPAVAQQYVAPPCGRLTASFVTAVGAPRRESAAPALATRPLLFARRLDGPQTGSPRTLAIEYSDGYRRRAKIHKYASFATLPLFGAEAWVGQSLYTNPTEAKKSLHLAIASGMGGLLAINSYTGVRNLIEAQKDPHGRGRRMLHGILLLAADGGFLGAALTAPKSQHERGAAPTPIVPNSSWNLHRTLAFSSISLTTVGYLIMLIR